MDADALKLAAAEAALEAVLPKLSGDSIVGIGTGSTADCFIDVLAAHRATFDCAVASSTASAERLASRGIRVAELNAVPAPVVYVDGADEVDPQRNLIKGGGGALTREKICAASADEFICIVDERKVVDVLGRYPLPVEVIPMARGLVARAIAGLGGEPVLREGYVTDNGNLILDIHGLRIESPSEFEQRLNNVVGIVCNGIFAQQRADQVIVAAVSGVHSI
jgi:ribose 5-phosphate isomerase A